MDFSVNPLLLNVILPLIGSEEKYFSIQVTGEALWQWRLIKPTYPENYFLALNKSLEKLSYEVASHASDRLKRRIKIELNFFSARLDGKNSKSRKVFRGKFLRVFQVAESEIVKVPQEAQKQTPTPPERERSGDKKTSNYTRLPEEEKEKVQKLVYILDRFGVSIQAYHEITQLEGRKRYNGKVLCY